MLDRLTAKVPTSKLGRNISLRTEKIISRVLWMLLLISLRRKNKVRIHPQKADQNEGMFKHIPSTLFFW
jgi:hypothetical protein